MHLSSIPRNWGLDLWGSKLEEEKIDILLGGIKMDYLKKLKEIASQEDIVSKITEAKTREDIQKILNDCGLEMTLEELDALFASIDLSAGNELSEDELDNVDGGGALSLAYAALKIAATKWKPIKMFNIIGN